MAHRRNRPPPSDQEARQAGADFSGEGPRSRDNQTTNQNPAGRQVRLTGRDIGTALLEGGKVLLGPDFEEHTCGSLAADTGLNLPALTIERQRAAMGWAATVLHWGLYIYAMYGGLPLTHVPPIEDDLCVEAIVSLDGHRPARVLLPGLKIFPPMILIRHRED